MANTVPDGALQRCLADFILDTRLADLPPPLVERLKWSLLDSLGCGVYGGSTEWGRIVTRYAAAQGSGPCRLWASGARTSVPAAALANGTLIQGFELDDIHYKSRSHPGSVTVPVALALAESGRGVSGEALLAALAVGYELLARVGACQGVSSFNRGWHPTGTAGAFASAATAARLLKLDRSACVHALGIAGTMPAGLMAAQYGAMVKRLYAGHAAWAGVTAALLAADGFTGIPDIFEAKYGGYPAALSDAPDLGPLADGLGSRFEAEGIGYKLFACVGTNHTTLEAVASLMREHRFDWRAVEAVEVRTSEYQALHSGWKYEPTTVMAAQMNMQYCVAVLLMEGKVFVDQFTPDLIGRADVLALARRVKVEADSSQDHADRTARVRILMRDGRSLEASCRAARGHPANPPTRADIEEKFLALAAKVIPEAACIRIAERVAHLEEASDAAEITALLC